MLILFQRFVARAESAHAYQFAVVRDEAGALRWRRARQAFPVACAIQLTPAKFGQRGIQTVPVGFTRVAAVHVNPAVTHTRTKAGDGRR